jgi:uncharacterized hydrophobic protein (TIGR00271 family)
MGKLREIFHHYFNLNNDDRAEEQAVIESVKRNIFFRGTNLWTLIFAIIIASVGLNVNSTAVIIGAMLISPLMGPIMGVGLGIGIADFDLVRKGLKNLLIAVVISMTTSALYFYITPLHNINSELLARTTPTIWDVFIAFTGGLAGIVGASRKEKSNVLPGVAIATALMPPLCTAGFGIATGHWYYFIGAVYLFFINSVFICIATVLIVRFMHFHRREFENEARRKRMARYMLLVVIVTTAPSIWLAYRIVQKTVFENAAQSFVRREFNFPNTQVISKNFVFSTKHPSVELLLIGQVLDSLQIDALKKKMNDYNIGKTELIVRQGMDARQQIDFAQVRASILDEVFKEADTGRVIRQPSAAPAFPDVRQELKVLFPKVYAYSLNKVTIIRTDTTVADSALLFIADYRSVMNRSEQLRMNKWLRVRLGESIQVIYRQAR